MIKNFNILAHIKLKSQFYQILIYNDEKDPNIENKVQYLLF